MPNEIYQGNALLTVPGISGQPIVDVMVKRLTKIPDERGAIFHMLRKDDEMFEKFGEIYFSKIYPGVVKAWHLHTKMTLNYAVVCGMVKIALYDDRENSLTKGNFLEIYSGEDNYLLVKIPSMVWNGFKGIGDKPALLANCSTMPHDPQEIKRLDPLSAVIPYNWLLKHA